MSVACVVVMRSDCKVRDGKFVYDEQKEQVMEYDRVPVAGDYVELMVGEDDHFELRRVVSVTLGAQIEFLDPARGTHSGDNLVIVEKDLA